MKKKIWAASPIFFILSAVMLAMAAVSWFWDKRVFALELLVALVAIVVVLTGVLRFRVYVNTVLKSASEAFKGLDKNSLERFRFHLLLPGRGAILYGPALLLCKTFATGKAA